VKAVLDGRADFAFVHNETWDGLSAFTTTRLHVLAKTEGREAFHMFMVSGVFRHRAEEVKEVLLALQDSSIGQEVLTELGFTRGLVPVTQGEFDAMIRLVGR
jgi:ABC-type phosphate/phosphonate transport system substrate-binding protein